MIKFFKSATSKMFLYFEILALLGTFVLQLPFCYKNAHPIPLIDSLFTAVSAMCVTGLSSLDMSIYTNAGLCVILFLIEAGGLGLVFFFTLFLVLSEKRISLSNRNFIQDFFTQDTIIETRLIIKLILFTTLIIQAIGAIFLSLILKTYNEPNFIFYGIFLSISAFCNAGFAPYSDSLVQFRNDPIFCLVICALIILGGIGFAVMFNIYKTYFSKDKNKKTILSLNTKIVLTMTAILIVFPMIAIFITEQNNVLKGHSIFQKFNIAFFESVTLRTAGFETIPQNQFTPAFSFVSMLAMLIGGSPGSMAGGFKTTTIFLLICLANKSKNDINSLSVFHTDIKKEALEKALSIFIKGLLLLFIIFFLLLITEHKNLTTNVFSTTDLFFESISALATVGLSRGITSQITLGGKILLIALMFTGRTGITFMSLFSLRSKKNLDSYTDYPEENVLIG